MKKFFETLRWRIQYEFACVNMTLTLLFSGVLLLCGILTALGGTNGEIYGAWNIPLCAFSPFFLVLFWSVAYIVLGLSFAVALSTPCRREGIKTARLVALFICTAILCYIWIPVVYLAESFLLGTLLCAVIVVLLASLFSVCLRINHIAAWGIFGFAGWVLYILYYTFSLFLLN